MDLIRRARRPLTSSLHLLSPRTNPVVSLLCEFLLLYIVLFFIWRVLVTGWWYYANELIFVTRGFGTDDVVKCMAVLREGTDPVEWRRHGAMDWYWRMQCEGNRDGVLGDGRVQRLNREWVWTLFDIFWAVVAGPLVYASHGIISTFQSIPFQAMKFEIVKWAGNDNWQFSPVAPFVAFGRWLFDASRRHSTRIYWSKRVHALWNPFDETPLGGLWYYLGTLVSTVIVVIGDLLAEASDRLATVSWVACVQEWCSSLSVVSATQAWDSLTSSISNLTSSTELTIPSINFDWRLWTYIPLIFSLLVAPLSWLVRSISNLCSTLDSTQKITYTVLLVVVLVWIHVYLYFKYYDNRDPITEIHHRSKWNIPFALINFIFFNGYDFDGREWHWDELPNLCLQGFILPITYDGVWKGLSTALSILRVPVIEVLERLFRLWVTALGSMVIMFVSFVYTYLLVDFPLARDISLSVLKWGSNFIQWFIAFHITVYVLIEIAIIVKKAWRRTFSQPPFSLLCPSNPDFGPSIWAILLLFWKQLLALALIILTNTIASSFGISTTLNYPEYLIYLMLGSILSAKETPLRFTLNWVLTPLLLSLSVYPFGACVEWFSWHNVGVAWSHLPNAINFLAAAAVYFFVPPQIKFLTGDDAARSVFILLDYFRVPGRRYIFSFFTRIRNEYQPTTKPITWKEALVLLFEVWAFRFIYVNYEFRLTRILLLAWITILLGFSKPHPRPVPYDERHRTDILSQTKAVSLRTTWLTVAVICAAFQVLYLPSLVYYNPLTEFYFPIMSFLVEYRIIIAPFVATFGGIYWLLYRGWLLIPLSVREYVAFPVTRSWAYIRRKFNQFIDQAINFFANQAFWVRPIVLLGLHAIFSFSARLYGLTTAEFGSGIFFYLFVATITHAALVAFVLSLIILLLQRKTPVAGPVEGEGGAGSGGNGGGIGRPPGFGNAPPSLEGQTPPPGPPSFSDDIPAGRPRPNENPSSDSAHGFGTSNAPPAPQEDSYSDPSDAHPVARTDNRMFQTTMECLLQIGAFVFAINTLEYLSLNIGFYSVTLPIGLSVFYLYSPYDRVRTVKRDGSSYVYPSPGRAHGFQALFANELVPGWAKHLWWIIPAWATCQSGVALLYNDEIHDHFKNYTVDHFTEAWSSASLLDVGFAVYWIAMFIWLDVTKDLTLLKLVRDLIEFLNPVWRFISYLLLPLIESKLRSILEFFLFPRSVKPEVSDLHHRALTWPILGWVIVVLQAYQPGVRSLGRTFALWTILRILPMADPHMYQLLPASQTRPVTPPAGRISGNTAVSETVSRKFLGVILPDVLQDRKHVVGRNAKEITEAEETMATRKASQAKSKDQKRRASAAIAKSKKLLNLSRSKTSSSGLSPVCEEVSDEAVMEELTQELLTPHKARGAPGTNKGDSSFQDDLQAKMAEMRASLDNLKNLRKKTDEDEHTGTFADAAKKSPPVAEKLEQLEANRAQTTNSSPQTTRSGANV